MLGKQRTRLNVGINTVLSSLMKKQYKQVLHPCPTCNRETWSKILYRHTESSDSDYRVDTHHDVVQCCGCMGVSFRKLVLYIEEAYPIGENDWEVPQDMDCYPSVLKGHQKLEQLEVVPLLVRDIYAQSLNAIRDQSNILAGMGLRATIEAICNDRSIGGKTLDKRIDGLAKGGLISTKDAERLHAIRFLGNDAAHEIQSSNEKNLLIALRIIEHLLVNIYILDTEADGKLETIIQTPIKFLKFLDTKLSHFTSGDEVPLAKILGKDIRRLHGYLLAHEQHLVQEIGNGSYTKLTVGKVDHYAGSKEKRQHFVVV